MAKNIVKINEAQLKKIVAESVKKVLNEAFTPQQYAYFTGAAQKAAKDNGGNALSRTFNPKQKAYYDRKQRQMEKFGRAAVGQANGNNYVQDPNEKGENFQNAISYKKREGYDTNDIRATYNPNSKGSTPFEMQRRQYNRYQMAPNTARFADGKNNGQRVSYSDLNNMKGDKVDAYDARGLEKRMTSLDKAYNKGMQGKPLNK